MRFMLLPALYLALLVPASAPMVAQAPAAAPASAAAGSSKIWIGRGKEIEEYLKTAEIVGEMEKLGVGVTNPHRGHFAPGGPFDKFVWKPLKPGNYKGYHESYKAEIAAYELDKALDMNMVPPTVERTIKDDTGAVVLWCENVQSFKELGGMPTPPSLKFANWNRQIVDAKMFDNLIYNKDPNLGNWLKDPEWNLILIDHSRSFTAGKDMAHELGRIDYALWEKMKALTAEGLTASLGAWLDEKEIKAVVERRDKMGELIDKMVKAKGEDAVFIK
jgi:hypothetical protein